MELLSAVLTLFLVMDPIGNVPVFLSYLKEVAPERRPVVVARESCFALAILLFFLILGPSVMQWLRIGSASLYIAGGVILFLIAVEMIFPGIGPMTGVGPLVAVDEEPRGSEPFIVPLAMPLLAGPSAFATLMIFHTRYPGPFWTRLAALLIAWGLSAAILMLSAKLSRLLGPRGLVAMERLMGMVLTVLAVQMFLDGVDLFLRLRGAAGGA
jgi:multiple antibiotic resistance protein